MNGVSEKSHNGVSDGLWEFVRLERERIHALKMEIARLEFEMKRLETEHRTRLKAVSTVEEFICGDVHDGGACQEND